MDNVNEVLVRVEQLKQFCQQTKEQLSMGEKNLIDLSRMIAYQAGPSRTGQEASAISNHAAKQLHETVQSVLTLERDLDAYIRQVTL